eukprot:TCALIF_08523-PA protein Name:"Similar to Ribonuclease Oy (Crassostrea gigas)" AED:0.17 eAED:0.17 QI:189/1/0.75/1/0.66/0.5/4/0/272
MLTLSQTLLAFGLLGPVWTARSRSSESHDDHFDLLIFAQNWPTTNCIEWKERDKQNTCTIPQGIWTVHGIWPTKNKTIGPNFCDRSKRFDPTRLAPILDDLEAHWTNVHANTGEYSFWKHEWEKHGTCAMELGPLDTEFKYFKQGITWNEQYPLSKFLNDAGIVPGQKYTFKEIFDAVQNRLGGHRPAVQCQYDDEHDVKTLAQINICFEKSLQLTDCDPIKGGVNLFCPRFAREIFYPESTRFNSAPLFPYGKLLGTTMRINLNQFKMYRE